MTSDIKLWSRGESRGRCGVVVGVVVDVVSGVVDQVLSDATALWGLTSVPLHEVRPRIGLSTLRDGPFAAVPRQGARMDTSPLRLRSNIARRSQNVTGSESGLCHRSHPFGSYP